MKETDEDEAVVAEENWGVSIADAGAYAHKGRAKIWARSDMDQVAVWDITRGQEGELEVSLCEFPAGYSADAFCVAAECT